jgi:AcrR family transcriptional regulator
MISPVDNPVDSAIYRIVNKRASDTLAAVAKRQRRSAEEAHALILDAAAKRLAQSGPQGIRLQEIAADVGISHPTILHHFGSRADLVEAVVDQALERLREDVVTAFADQRLDAGQGAQLVHRVMATLGEQGHARLMAWLSLEGRTGDDARLLQGLATMIHARRQAENDHVTDPEDTLFAVLLVGLALFGEGVLAQSVYDSAGLGDDDEAKTRFHAWLVRLLEKHLHGPGV